MIPYVDPKMFNRRKNNEDLTKPYRPNEKRDVYSVGMLLWEISSGRPPFYVEGERYDVGLVYDILEGLKETIIPWFLIVIILFLKKKIFLNIFFRVLG